MTNYRPQTLQQKLGWLVEECGEVQSAVGKTLRWGIHSVNPELEPSQVETNGAWILRELKDLEEAAKLVRTEIQRRLFSGSRQQVANLPPLDVLETLEQKMRLERLARDLIEEMPFPASKVNKWKKRLGHALTGEKPDE